MRPRNRMKILVLGAGVEGVTSAYYLARQGHSVTIIYHMAGPALQTSFANAGQIRFGYACPWPTPGIPRKADKMMYDQHPALTIRPDGMRTHLKRLLLTWRRRTAARYHINKERMGRLDECSRPCMAERRAQTDMQLEHLA